MRSGEHAAVGPRAAQVREETSELGPGNHGLPDHARRVPWLPAADSSFYRRRKGICFHCATATAAACEEKMGSCKIIVLLQALLVLISTGTRRSNGEIPESKARKVKIVNEDGHFLELWPRTPILARPGSTAPLDVSSN
ncbi:hypothetical protein BHE74_00014544 [Ensete ventricosum]|nr:hypothetical protein BHE74_00014544 [Ensete ventricosum]